MTEFEKVRAKCRGLCLVCSEAACPEMHKRTVESVDTKVTVNTQEYHMSVVVLVLTIISIILAFLLLSGTLYSICQYVSTLLHIEFDLLFLGSGIFSIVLVLITWLLLLREAFTYGKTKKR